MDGRFSLPAGAIDGNENLEDAVIREAKEEVGVTLLASDLRLVHTMHCWTESNEWLGAYFVADKWSGDPRIMEPEKHSEIQWNTFSGLPNDLIPYVKQALENYAAENPFSTYRPIN
jgi:ADP-ribose pyrophosphatase YjhB (NUDIX family)